MEEVWKRTRATIVGNAYASSVLLVGYFIITNIIFLHFILMQLVIFSSHVVFLSSLAEPLPQIWFELVGTSAFIWQQRAARLKAANYTSLGLKGLYRKVNCHLVPLEVALLPLVTLPKLTFPMKSVCSSFSLVCSCWASLVLSLLRPGKNLLELAGHQRGESREPKGDQGSDRCLTSCKRDLFFTPVPVSLFIPKCFVLGSIIISSIISKWVMNVAVELCTFFKNT